MPQGSLEVRSCGPEVAERGGGLPWTAYRITASNVPEPGHETSIPVSQVP